jgi:hypothetical protein
MKDIYLHNLSFLCVNSLLKLLCTCLLEGCPPQHIWLVGDGACFDETNNVNCDFDGGDCCSPYSCYLCFDWCQDCICYEDLNCNGPLELIGNGHCNDQTNNAECNFDGGDCCGSCANMEQCSECWCLDGSPPNYQCKLSK